MLNSPQVIPMTPLPQNDREVMKLLLDGATIEMTDDIHVVEYAMNEKGYLCKRVYSHGNWSPWAMTLFLPSHRHVTSVRKG